MRVRARGAAILAMVMTLVVPGLASAQAWPNRPVRMIVPFPPGGALDTVGRVFARSLADQLAVSVVVDNRAGASGTIGVSEGARAPADGYTLLFTSSDTITILPLLRKNLPFDVTGDLVPIVKLADVYTLIAANPKFDGKTIRELVDLARAKPGAVRFASPGNGSVNHIVFEEFKARAHVDVQHIPYNGGGPATTAVIAGQVEILSSGTNVFKAVQGGQLRALAVAKATRWQVLPDVPTLVESGFPDFVASSWFGLFVPAGTSRGVVDRIEAAASAVSNAADYRERVRAVGGDVELLAGAAFRDYLAAESRRWGDIIARSRIRLEE